MQSSARSQQHNDRRYTKDLKREKPISDLRREFEMKFNQIDI